MLRKLREHAIRGKWFSTILNSINILLTFSPWFMNFLNNEIYIVCTYVYGRDYVDFCEMENIDWKTFCCKNLFKIHFYSLSLLLHFYLSLILSHSHSHRLSINFSAQKGKCLFCGFRKMPQNIKSLAKLRVWGRLFNFLALHKRQLLENAF
jgi:hypothetical protein